MNSSRNDSRILSGIPVRIFPEINPSVFRKSPPRILPENTSGTSSGITQGIPAEVLNESLVKFIQDLLQKILHK